jgi:hypothetical protein
VEAENPLPAARFRKLTPVGLSRLHRRLEEAPLSLNRLQVSLKQAPTAVPRFFDLYEKILRAPIPQHEIDAYAARREKLEHDHPDHEHDTDLHEQMDWVLPPMTVVQGIGMWLEKAAPLQLEETSRGYSLLKLAESHSHPLVAGLAKSWEDRLGPGFNRFR